MADVAASVLAKLRNKAKASEMRFVKRAFCKNCKYPALLTNKGDVGRHLPC